MVALATLLAPTVLTRCPVDRAPPLPAPTHDARPRCRPGDRRGVAPPWSRQGGHRGRRRRPPDRPQRPAPARRRPPGGPRLGHERQEHHDPAPGRGAGDGRRRGLQRDRGQHGGGPRHDARRGPPRPVRRPRDRRGLPRPDRPGHATAGDPPDEPEPRLPGARRPEQGAGSPLAGDARRASPGPARSSPTPTTRSWPGQSATTATSSGWRAGCGGTSTGRSAGPAGCASVETATTGPAQRAAWPAPSPPGAWSRIASWGLASTSRSTFGSPAGPRSPTRSSPWPGRPRWASTRRALWRRSAVSTTWTGAGARAPSTAASCASCSRRTRRPGARSSSVRPAGAIRWSSSWRPAAGPARTARSSGTPRSSGSPGGPWWPPGTGPPTWRSACTSPGSTSAIVPDPAAAIRSLPPGAVDVAANYPAFLALAATLGG